MIINIYVVLYVACVTFKAHLKKELQMDKYATLRLPKQVHSEVKILAVTRGMTMTDYVAFLVKQEKAKKEVSK